MTRSPLTLAASVTAALPEVAIVGAAALTSSEAGRFDSALVTTDDARVLVVRAPNDEESARELAAEALSLRALTTGARALLPFRAPELHGEVSLAEGRAIVTDFLDGYRVDAAHVPPGRGVATSIGQALAALHALPESVVRSAGLPHRTPAQARDDVRGLLDRAAQTRRLPVALASRWRDAVEDDALWRFDTRVVLGSASAGSFVLADIDDVPTVVGVLGWHGLGVGDPAVDLHWLAAAPQAADDVYGAYASHGDRAPDPELRIRARLYAEMEFASWLVHGHDLHRDDIVDDAVSLLDALVDGLGTGAASLSPVALVGVDDAIAVIAAGTPVDEDRAPATAASIAMQTDAYDPGMLSLYEPDETAAPRSPEQDAVPAETPGSRRAGLSARETAAPGTDDDTAPGAPVDATADPLAGREPRRVPISDQVTSPLELDGQELPQIAPRGARRHAAAESIEGAASVLPQPSSAAPEDDDAEIERASRAAFQRWASSSSE